MASVVAPISREVARYHFPTSEELSKKLSEYLPLIEQQVGLIARLSEIFANTIKTPEELRSAIALVIREDRFTTSTPSLIRAMDLMGVMERCARLEYREVASRAPTSLRSGGLRHSVTRRLA